jgi:hypothetical protein
MTTSMHFFAVVLASMSGCTPSRGCTMSFIL